MQTTRREILDDFLGWVTEGGDSVARNLAERALNRAVLALWLKQPWAQFRANVPYTFTTTAGIREYVLPAHFGRIAHRDGLIRNTTRGIDLTQLDQSDLDSFDGLAGTSLETQGQPRRYVLDNTVGVSVQPATTGEACEVVSSDALDVAVRVFVEGFDANGLSTRTQVTLTGTTPVAVGTWSRIERFGKSYPEGIDPTTELTSSAGTVTLRVVAGATLQTLSSDRSAVELPVLTLYPLPDTAESYVVPYMRAPQAMLRDADPLPRFWGNALFEEMQIAWHVNRGKLLTDAQVPRPHLADLIALENSNRVARTRHRTPFGG